MEEEEWTDWLKFPWGVCAWPRTAREREDGCCVPALQMSVTDANSCCSQTVSPSPHQNISLTFEEVLKEEAKIET